MARPLFEVNKEPYDVNMIKRLFHPNSKLITNLHQLNEHENLILDNEHNHKEKRHTHKHSDEQEENHEKYDKNLLKSEKIL